MTVGTTTTDYILDGSNVIQEKVGTTVTARYMSGNRGPEYRRGISTPPEWYVFDGLGSVVATVSDSGVVQSTKQFDVYGSVRASSGGTPSKHKYVGNLGHTSEDETGLIYMRARYMDPVTGRFESEDPKQDGVNWFAYCSDNPINVTDPTGLSIIGDLGSTLLSMMLGAIGDSYINATVVGMLGGGFIGWLDYGAETGDWLSWGALWGFGRGAMWGAAGGAGGVFGGRLGDNLRRGLPGWGVGHIGRGVPPVGAFDPGAGSGPMVPRPLPYQPPPSAQG
ncbi:MAG: RHS repeat-associated core domain-containing protein [Armatimonadetes bacterium]|nr:RHS repeat-associated core domain-containing protein [Armatimonadota bacterium]